MGWTIETNGKGTSGKSLLTTWQVDYIYIYNDCSIKYYFGRLFCFCLIQVLCLWLFHLGLLTVEIFGCFVYDLFLLLPFILPSVELNVCVSLRVCVYIYTCVRTSLYIYVCVCVCVCLCVRLCVRIFINLSPRARQDTLSRWSLIGSRIFLLRYKKL